MTPTDLVLGATLMDFFLRYRGQLPTCSRSNSRGKEKHAIRVALSPQLEDLWKKTRILSGRFDSVSEVGVKKHRLEIPDGLNSYFQYVTFKNIRFLPLVTRHLHLVCHLHIRFLRRDNPGSIVQGGDIDNRMKTLFDALRIPLENGDVPASHSMTDGKFCYCLLEDDSLITNLSIETGRLLGPMDKHEKETDVDLSIHVTIKASHLTLNNIGLQS